MYFEVTWPDGRRDRCYSPSRIVEEHLKVGDCYEVDDFVARVRVALHVAAERVRAKYGYYCSAAMDQLARIEEKASALNEAERRGSVRVEGFDRSGTP
jgi:uncharacterized repeat protein (TIGR04042 family)